MPALLNAAVCNPERTAAAPGHVTLTIDTTAFKLALASTTAINIKITNGRYRPRPWLWTAPQNEKHQGHKARWRYIVYATRTELHSCAQYSISWSWSRQRLGNNQTSPAAKQSPGSGSMPRQTIPQAHCASPAVFEALHLRACCDSAYPEGPYILPLWNWVPKNHP